MNSSLGTPLLSFSVPRSVSSVNSTRILKTPPPLGPANGQSSLTPSFCCLRPLVLSGLPSGAPRSVRCCYSYVLAPVFSTSLSPCVAFWVLPSRPCLSRTPLQLRRPSWCARFLISVITFFATSGVSFADLESAQSASVIASPWSKLHRHPKVFKKATTSFFPWCVQGLPAPSSAGL